MPIHCTSAACSPKPDRLLAVAASFERIYRQNADNAGLLTSTDLSLADRLARGEPVELDELLADRDPLAAQIVRAGGLLKFGRGTSAALAPAPLPESPRPMTLFDKIVARHALASPALPAPRAVGDGGFVAADLRFIHE